MTHKGWAPPSSSEVLKRSALHARQRRSTLTFAPPDPATYMRFFLPIFCGLLALGLASAMIVHETSSTAISNAAKLFLFDRERNLPTLFNFSIILVNAVLCTVAAAFVWRDLTGWPMTWLSLGGLLFLMAFDEAAQLHERADFLGRYLVTPTGAFALPWVAAGGLAVVCLALVYLRFVVAQSTPIRRLIFLSAALFVSGALGVEMIAAYTSEHEGIQKSMNYEMLATLEEAMEMTGLMAFGYAVLTFLQSGEVRTRDMS